MAASYPTSVKTFTTKVDNVDDVAAADCNDLQNEVNAIETGLLNGIEHDLIPDADDTRALGSSSKGWQGFFTTVSASDQPRCSAYNSTTQSVPSSTLTALTLDSEDFDVGDMHSTASNTSRLTVPTGAGGLYLITGRCIVTNAVAASFTYLELWKNGTSTGTRLMRAGGLSATTSTAPAYTITCLAELAESDYVELAADQNSGSSVNAGSSTTGLETRFQAVKLW